MDAAHLICISAILSLNSYQTTTKPKSNTRLITKMYKIRGDLGSNVKIQITNSILNSTYEALNEKLCNPYQFKANRNEHPIETLYYIKTAWNKVSSAMIQNCFKKAGFQKNNGDSTSLKWDPEDYLPLSTIVQIERCADKINITQENLKNYIRIDDIAATEEMSLNTDNVIENMIERDPAPEKEEDSDLKCDTVESSNAITTYNEAFNVINDLKTFANDYYIAFQYLKNLDHFQYSFLK
ncbi:hypothetical protein FQA39_LY18274 [Lamprigera yunnana]|nr:hypothetical protein FQA39_LY18274 [Lamprigera yunnana]